jgi:ABC-type phosphate transport system permease subunit
MNKKKRELRQARRTAKQEQQAKKVINWICGVLVVLAIALIVTFMVRWA